jgi:hypothetical protein
VEYNTVAVSLLAVADRVKLLQRYINDKYRSLLTWNYEPDL